MSFPSDLLFYATYNNSIAADYSKLGSVTPVTSNGDTINTTTKNCGAGSIYFNSAPGYVKYSGGCEVVDKGTLSCYIYIPDATPVATAYPIYLRGASTANNIRIFVNRWSVPPVCAARIYDSSSSLIFQIVATAGDFSLVTWHHLELDFDITDGESRLFIDGVQTGSTHTGTGTRIAIADYLYCGLFAGTSEDFYVDNIQIYNTVRHTANFSPSCDLLPPLSPLTFPLNTFGYPFGFPSKRGLAR